eukprot:TRINITY_DN1874_c0_g1_i1.p1 TRINITY_DN1874_c0_g1~~TRINITY_DN1874_c0_g1_i1.p1  ORF type:complete len:264 (+),score=30.90 TRINITY_DN1874_c0_g1_i1:55-846(+)
MLRRGVLWAKCSLVLRSSRLSRAPISRLQLRGIKDTSGGDSGPNKEPNKEPTFDDINQQLRQKQQAKIQQIRRDRKAVPQSKYLSDSEWTEGDDTFWDSKAAFTVLPPVTRGKKKKELVIPDNEEVEETQPIPIQLREQDLEEIFVRSSGPGGQHVNKTSSCVILKHLPSGTIVKCQETRSLEVNRRKARHIMHDKLDQMINGSRSISAQRQQKIRKQKDRRRRRANKLQELEADQTASQQDGTQATPSLGTPSSLESAPRSS